MILVGGVVGIAAVGSVGLRSDLVVFMFSSVTVGAGDVGISSMDSTEPHPVTINMGSIKLVIQTIALLVSVCCIQPRWINSSDMIKGR